MQQRNHSRARIPKRDGHAPARGACGSRRIAPIVALASAVMFVAAATVSTQAQDRAGQNALMSITGHTNASEVIRESRFDFMDLNDDGYLSQYEVPDDDLVLKSMFSSLDENDDGRLSEPEYVLNGNARPISGEGNS